MKLSIRILHQCRYHSSHHHLLSPLHADGNERKRAGVHRGRLHQGDDVAEYPSKGEVAQTEEDYLQYEVQIVSSHHLGQKIKEKSIY